MKKIVTFLIIVVAVSSLALADENRTLEHSLLADSIDRIMLDGGVGRIEVEGRDVDTISFTVRLEPRRGGFFSSKKKALREVLEAKLSVETRGKTVHIKIESESDDRRFEERWHLEVPKRIAFELDFGVGDVVIDGIEGGIELSAGVCDVVIDVPKGSMQIDIGVGDLSLKMPQAMIGNVECSVGVGDATIKVDGERRHGEGFIGHTVSYSGEGANEIVIEIGVGEASVKAS